MMTWRRIIKKLLWEAKNAQKAALRAIFGCFLVILKNLVHFFLLILEWHTWKHHLNVFINILRCFGYPRPKNSSKSWKMAKNGCSSHFWRFFGAIRTKIHKLFFLDIQPTWREEYFENIFFQNFEVLGVQGTQNGPLLGKNFFWKFFLEKKYLDMKVGFNICWLIPISMR